MNIYQNNLKILEERFPEIVQDMEEQSACSNLYYIENENKTCIPFAKTEQGEYRLNSYYHPQSAAKAFAERYGADTSYKIYAVLGLSDGSYIRALLERLDDTNIVLIYEPELSWLNSFLEQYDYSDILEHPRVGLVAGDVESGYIEQCISSIIDYARKDLVVPCILPNYDILFPKQGEYFIELLYQRIKWSMITCATYEWHSACYLDNLYCVIPDMIQSYTLDQLVSCIKEMDISHIPAIIVAAGPSLDQNIHLLKHAKGKALIIVVDMALRAVLEAGVQPDLVISVDPVVGERMKGIAGMEKQNVVLQQYSSKSLIQKNEGKHFYDLTVSSYIKHFYAREGKMCELNLPTGGSVSCNAFSMAIAMGFQTIVFMGQDLAFTGGKYYTKGTRETTEQMAELFKASMPATVEGIHGELLQTENKMEGYLQWFEREIKKYPDIQVIDATEGGALIHGTVIKTFQEVLEENCQRDFDMDAIIKEMEPVFTKEQQAQIQSELKEIPTQLKELKEVFEDGIQAYQELKEWGETKGQNQKEYETICQKIKEVDDRISSEVLMEILELYNRKESNETEDMIYKTKDLEVKDLAEQGKILLNSYSVAVDKMLCDLEELPYFW